MHWMRVSIWSQFEYNQTWGSATTSTPRVASVHVEQKCQVIAEQLVLREYLPDPLSTALIDRPALEVRRIRTVTEHAYDGIHILFTILAICVHPRLKPELSGNHRHSSTCAQQTEHACSAHTILVDQIYQRDRFDRCGASIGLLSTTPTA